MTAPSPPDPVAATASPPAASSLLERLEPLRPWQDVCAGVVLGAAIGDAMGHPTEFISSVAGIRAKYGALGVTKFELFWERDGQRFAPYTDDTQLAEVVLRSLLHARDAGLDLDATMVDLSARFIAWSHHPQGGHRAAGNACLAGCHALETGAHWSQAGGPTAGGCGSVMRAYPFGLLFAHDLRKARALGGRALQADTSRPDCAGCLCGDGGGRGEARAWRSSSRRQRRDGGRGLSGTVR
jgi:hypothetical protein